MKYKISIEGGFTGIPREYKGVVDMDKSEKSVLLKTLDKGEIPMDSDLRDGFLYHIEVIYKGKSHRATYRDLSIPIEVQRFIDWVKP